MLPFVTYGIADASTTRNPSIPRTFIVRGSTTDRSSVPIRHVHEGCSAVSPFPAHPVQDLLVGLHLLARGELTAVERTERRLREDRPRDLDRLHPFLPILVGRQVVEPERRVHPGIGAHDLHRPPRVRVHRSDVHLVAVVPGRSRPVVANGDGQEVEHQVRIGDLVVAPDEAARLEMVRGPEARTEEQPLGPDERLPPQLQARGDRHGLRAGMLHVDLEVILEMLADPGNVLHHVDAQRAELVRVADPRELQDLRRVDGAAAQDHLARPNRPRRTRPARVLDPDRSRPVEQDPVDERPGAHVEVRPARDRVQVGAGGRQPAPAMHVPVERREALLAIPVHIVGQGVPGLLDRFEERTEQRALRRTALEHERAAVASVLIGWLRRQAALHATEVGEAVGMVPRVHARVGRPSLVVERVAPLEDHPVDAARSPEHLASRVVDASSAHVGLRLGLVLPVVPAPTDRVGERRGHVDEHVPQVVGAAGLQDQHLVGRVGREPVGEHTAGRTAADDHVVEGPIHRWTVCPKWTVARSRRNCASVLWHGRANS